tara:strand:- start:3416 stop:3622 length:207 start_codon:yes stop_codon:yes gene_type:complete
MEDSPAKTNTKLLMDIQYSIKELTTSVTALKYELAYIKSNLHTKPPKFVTKDIEEETPESIKNWWWSA